MFPDKIAPGSWPYHEGDKIPFTSGMYIVVHGIYCGPALPPVAKSAEIIPQASDLRVFPNPFSDKVRFDFTLEKDANVVLEINNMLGQKVTTLMDQRVEGGVMNTVEFKPTYEVSGMYIYRFTVDGKTQIGKLIYKNE